MADADGTVVDLVLFSLKPDVSPERFLGATSAASDWVRRRAGFVSRELYRAADNRWFEIVQWTGAHAADSAYEVELNAEECRPMFHLIDESSQMIVRGTRAIDPVRARDDS